MLHKGKSKFQTVEVVKTKPFGSLLVTDGLMQSSEDDEYVYHQSLVHPVMTANFPLESTTRRCHRPGLDPNRGGNLPSRHRARGRL